MGDYICVIVDGDPIGKGRPRFTRATGRIYTPAKTEKYEDRLRDTAANVMGDRSRLEGPLEVSVLVYVRIPESWSTRKRQDAARGLIRPTGKPHADNYLKLALDACNRILWNDDSQVTDMLCRKRYAEKPSLQIYARAIEAAELLNKEAA